MQIVMQAVVEDNPSRVDMAESNIAPADQTGDVGQVRSKALESETCTCGCGGMSKVNLSGQE
jgi:hypothetical protein